jgi:hypothetical protein
MRPLLAILLRLPDCLENAAHIFLVAGCAGRMALPKRQQFSSNRGESIEQIERVVRIG